MRFLLTNCFNMTDNISYPSYQSYRSHPSYFVLDHRMLSSHAYSSIALMISSRSFGTCTARLANAARFTPRLPSFSSNVFGSDRVVRHRRVRVFQHVPGQHAHHAVVGGRSRLPCTSFSSPATLAALAGSQPRPPAPTFAFASRISWSVASRTTPPQRSSARSAFGRFTGRLISMALASVSARRFAASSRRHVVVDLRRVELARRSSAGRASRKAGRTCSAPAALTTASRGDAVDQPEFLQLDERLAEARHVAEVAAGHHDPVRHLPPQRFQHAEHDRLLPFEPERVDAVDEVDAELPAHFLHAAQGVVEVAGDLHRQRAVVERLRQLAVARSCPSR